jgi:cell wall assembly regulator SMI1
VGLPTTEAGIAAAEKKLGRRLPGPLRERLLRNNGGEIRIRIADRDEDEVWELHPVWDEATRETKRRSASHLVRAQTEARDWPDFPPDAIAIAQYDGDQLLLSPNRDDPAVWLHETGELIPVVIDWS